MRPTESLNDVVLGATDCPTWESDRGGLANGGIVRSVVGGDRDSSIRAAAGGVDSAAMVGFGAHEDLLDHDGKGSSIYMRTGPKSVEAVRAVWAAHDNPGANEVEDRVRRMR